jgi:hypothetical protein
VDEAAGLLDSANSIDPLAEERYVRLAHAFLTQGRTRRAQRVVDQAMAVCTETDVEPGPELEALLAEFARQG